MCNANYINDKEDSNTVIIGSGFTSLQGQLKAFEQGNDVA
jgi:hypothetical protein